MSEKSSMVRFALVLDAGFHSACEVSRYQKMSKYIAIDHVLVTSAFRARLALDSLRTAANHT